LRVVLDLRTETYRVLDEAGSAFWSVLTGEAHAAAAFGALADRYAVDEPRLRAELGAFAERCLAEGLLERDGSRALAPPAAASARGRALRLRPLFLRALLYAVATQRALARDGFKATYERYARLPAGPEHVGLDAALAAFGRAEHFFLMRRAPDDCLARSLALYRFLRSAGVAAEHVIGVRRFPFGAHAWVECDGAPLLDGTPHEYVPLARAGTG
jgi:hypothetical protein